MSTLKKRTKIIIGVTLTVSLAVNFFFLGWLVGTSPLVPGSLAGRLGAAAGLLRPPPGSGMSPEQRFVGFLAHDLSETGHRKVLAALDSRASDIRDLERQAITIRAEIVSLLLQPEPDRPRVAKRIEDFEQLTRRRIAIVSAAILPVVLDLGLEDRRTFIERWAMGPGAPPPPPPPR
ncbi:periplasmic heavy metal sensor [Shumkonia mesophila]|uniref:periplasmic heavy metal sensor n=1 Tax=Shumkonia mesophila TaxID=2838854 RepID=UPI00293445B8|nr:periplasmic heavy metal sensor [Shumkonia mesophila]